MLTQVLLSGTITGVVGSLLGLWIGGLRRLVLSNIIAPVLVLPFVLALIDPGEGGLAFWFGFAGAGLFAAQLPVLLFGYVRYRRARSRRMVSEPPESDGKSVLMARHWRGERSLASSVFVSGLAALVVLAGLIFGLGGVTKNLPVDTTVNGFAFATSITLAVFALGIWYVVGILRAALTRTRALRAQGRRSFAAPAVIAFAGIGIVCLVLLLGRSLMPGAIQTGRIVWLGDPDMAPYTIRIMRHGTEAEIIGGFKHGLARDLSDRIKQNPNLRTLHLFSGGGRVEESVAVARLVKTHKLDTYVARECDSACTVVFAAGAHRWLDAQGSLGFHAGRGVWGDLSTLFDSAVPGAMRDAYARAGFAADFIAHAQATPSTTLWRPTLPELQAARVVTDVSDGSQFAWSGLPDKLDWAAFMRGVAETQPVVAALQKHDATDFARVEQVFRDGYAQMQSRQDVVAQFTKALSEILVAKQPLGDDETMQAYASLLADEYAALGAKDSAACYRYAFGGGPPTDLSTQLPKPIFERHKAWQVRTIETAQPDPQAEADGKVWTAVLDGVRKTLGPRKAALFTAKNHKPQQYADYCEVVTAAFRGVAALPREKAAPIMRDILKNAASENTDSAER